MDPVSVENIRKAIDQVDDQIHDLLMQRVVLTEPLSALKAASGTTRDFIRPAREAQLLRRLLARHDGALPPDTILYLWRELIAAHLRLQGPFSVHVYGGQQDLDYWDLARAYYGTTTPMTLHHSLSRVLRGVRDGKGAIGIVPVPALEEPDPAWWEALLEETDAAMHIVARLPFLTGPDVALAHPPAYVIANADPMASGDDTTVLAITTEPDVSRSWIQSRFGSLGLELRCIAIRDGGAQARHRHYLCETRHYHTQTDDRLTTLSADADNGILQARVVGAFANPVVLDQSMVPAEPIPAGVDAP